MLTRAPLSKPFVRDWTPLFCAIAWYVIKSKRNFVYFVSTDKKTSFFLFNILKLCFGSFMPQSSGRYFVYTICRLPSKVFQKKFENTSRVCITMFVIFCHFFKSQIRLSLHGNISGNNVSLRTFIWMKAKFSHIFSPIPKWFLRKFHELENYITFGFTYKEKGWKLGECFEVQKCQHTSFSV